MDSNKINSIIHKNSSNSIYDIISNTSGVEIKYNLAKSMEERGLTQRALSLLTGIRQASISDMCNGVGVQISKAHLLALMITLRTTDISDIFEVKFSKELRDEFEAERAEWLETKRVPDSVLRQAVSNVNSNK